MKSHFQKVESALDHLNTRMILLYSMVKKEHPPTVDERTFFEGGSGCGGGSAGGGGSGSGTDKGKRKEDPQSEKSKSIEDSLTKGEKQGELGEDKGKGKHVMSDEDFYYQGEQDNYDVFNIQQDQVVLPDKNEAEQEASFEDWEEGEVSSDPNFNEEFKKQ